MSDQRSVTVVLRANISDYQREMAKATTPLDDLVKKSGDASGQATTLMGKLAQSARHQSAEWRTAGASLLVAGSAMTALNVGVANAGISYNTLQQTSRAALRTLTGSAEAANAQMDKLDAFARTSPFSKSVFLQAQQQMLGFGIAAEKVVPYLDAIQNTTAAVGGNNQTISDLTRIMSQISSSAKITATDLMQFGDRGVDAAALIGSQMGKTAAQIREDITDGALDAHDALDALAAGMQERFGGAAAGMKDTFEGAIDRVKAAFRDLAADLMSSAVDPDGGGWLVDTANLLADLMRAVEQLPGPVKTSLGALSGFGGVALIAAGGFMTLVPQIYETQRAWKALADTFPRGQAAIKNMGAAAGATAGLLAGLMIAKSVTDLFREGAPVADDYAAALIRVADAADRQSLENLFDGLGGPMFEAHRLDPIAQAMRNIDQHGADVVGRFFGINDAADRAIERFDMLSQAMMDASAESAIATYEQLQLAAAQDEVGWSTEKLHDHLGDYIARLQLSAAEAGLAELTHEQLAALLSGGVVEGYRLAANGAIELADGSVEASDAMRDGSDAAGQLEIDVEALTDALEAQAQAMQDNVDAIRGYYDAILAAENSAIALESSFDKATEAVEKNGRTLDINTEKGRNNRQALLGIASAALKNADDMNAAQASTADMTASLERARENFITTAERMGMTGDEAAAYADQLGLIPEAVVTAITLPAVGDAQAQADELWRTLDSYPPEVRSMIRIGVDKSGYWEADQILNSINGRTVTANVALRTYGQAAMNTGGYVGDVQRLAGGGQGFPRRHSYIMGPGSTTADMVPTMLSVKEFVQNARSTSYYGVDAQYAMNSLRGDRAAVRAALGLADGGQPYAGAARYTQSSVPSQLALRPQHSAQASAPLPREDHFHFHGTDPVKAGQWAYSRMAHDRQKEVVSYRD